VWDEVKQHFRPEFLNRIDETVVFHALDQANIESIAKIQLKALEARLAKMDMQLEVSPAALAELAKAGFDPVFGASAQAGHPAAHREPGGQADPGRQVRPKDVIPIDVEGGEFSFGRVVH
jgi:ATP-dependent Clp protease ATP-binding subunit ClpB